LYLQLGADAAKVHIVARHRVYASDKMYLGGIESKLMVMAIFFSPLSDPEGAIKCTSRLSSDQVTNLDVYFVCLL
jgi:hypothetical protein